MENYVTSSFEARDNAGTYDRHFPQAAIVLERIT